MYSSLLWTLRVCYLISTFASSATAGFFQDEALSSALDTLETGSYWAAALSSAEKLVQRMTLEEQNNITIGYGSDYCAGFTGTAERVGFHGLCLNDGPAGVRGTDFVNAYPAGISVGASWNQKLAAARGLYLGKEFKAKGAHIGLGPVVEPLGRIAEGGRNWEGFGADPYLSGKLAGVTITGMQKSVIANIKHYIGYEQETNRIPHFDVKAYSSNIPDETIHEIYLWPFQDAVRANVGSVMCSYNRVNEAYACENNHTLNGLLKGELAFQGPVISDFNFGQQSGNAISGLDMAMPTSSYWDKNQLVSAVHNKTLPASRLADMAKRILAAWYLIIGGPDSSFPPGGFGLEVNQLTPHRVVEARDPASKPIILQSAIEGHVLVKNVKNALPLKKPKMLSLYGYDAPVFKQNYPSSFPYAKWYIGLQPVEINQTAIDDVVINGALPNPPEDAVRGTYTIGGGSGANQGAYYNDPYSAFMQQAENDDTYLLWDFISVDPLVHPSTDACLVFINEAATEGIDRPGLADPKSDKLVKNVASSCSNTIVIIHNAGIRVVDAWIDNPNVTAVMYAHLPGQVSGKALLSVLYGHVSPSGRLPYTVAKDPSDYGPLLTPCMPTSHSDLNIQCNFTRGLIDYRRFLSYKITPRFAFGYGLTYSSFHYSDLSAKWLTQSLPTKPPNPMDVAPGGIKSLFDTLATASVTVKNVGSVLAAEVPQLYVQFPGEPDLRVLRGFAKEELKPQGSAQVQFNLTRRDLSRWNTAAQSWELQTGKYVLHVGPNVEDIALTASLSR